MNKHILISTPNLSAQGGVSSYWNSILPELTKILNINTIEIGGNKKNIFGPLIDQYKFSSRLKEKPSLVILNPSLGIKSFFRDGFFSKKLKRNNIPFIVFFHGWNLKVENIIEKKYVKFFLNSFAYAKKIIVLSKNAKTKLLKWGYKGEIIIETTTVNSSLIQNFSIEDRLKNINKNKIRILFLARLFKEKGIYELINAFNNLNNKYENLELIIAGDGNEYKNILKLYKNSENIKVLGHVEGQEKINCFINSDIYCLPSYSEGLPGTVLEAMAFALPIITTPVGGLKEFFINKEMGYFTKVKSIKDLELKIEILILDKEIHKTIAYHNKKMSNKYLDTKTAQRIVKYIREEEG